MFYWETLDHWNPITFRRISYLNTEQVHSLSAGWCVHDFCTFKRGNRVCTAPTTQHHSRETGHKLASLLQQFFMVVFINFLMCHKDLVCLFIAGLTNTPWAHLRGSRTPQDLLHLRSSLFWWLPQLSLLTPGCELQKCEVCTYFSSLFQRSDRGRTFFCSPYDSTKFFHILEHITAQDLKHIAYREWRVLISVDFCRVSSSNREPCDAPALVWCSSNEAQELVQPYWMEDPTNLAKSAVQHCCRTSSPPSRQRL